ncbi:hypothetical protein DFH07DRAFT_511384 [Mycena maculata]|uniref:Uncharacterized protein n=1 Tax=Mycena maculata TaxID=230809 RepID=A0AAD7J2U0_9AGAR|nr:hypothetical protein DFH07DRAFT_511384 [Mycena maculata]
MAGSDLYSRLLLPTGNGYPLFHPQPFDDLPEPARRTGTAIGDVGIVTPNGSFDPIFNILRAGDDAANRFGVPLGFERLILRPNSTQEQIQEHLPGAHISNSTINKRRLDIEAGLEANVFVPFGAGAVIEVSTKSKETGLLLLPDGASRWDLRSSLDFLDYALKHGQSWYAFVRGDLRRLVGDGDLYLVTGVTKSTSWSVAVDENQSGDGNLSLKLKATPVGNAGTSWAWEWEGASSSKNSGPRRRPGEESWRDNQTVFIRGFKVALRSFPLRRAAKVLMIPEGRNPKWSNISSRSFPSSSQTRSEPTPMSNVSQEPSNSAGEDPNPNPTDDDTQNPPSTPGGSDSASDDEVPSVYHPADIINQYLLHCAPGAMVAVTHDDTWISVLDGVGAEVSDRCLCLFIHLLGRPKNSRRSGAYEAHLKQLHNRDRGRRRAPPGCWSAARVHGKDADARTRSYRLSSRWTRPRALRQPPSYDRQQHTQQPCGA